MRDKPGNLNVTREKPVGPWWRVRTALLGYWLDNHRLAPRRVTMWMQHRWLPVRYDVTFF